MLRKNKVAPQNVTIDRRLGEQNFSKDDSQAIREEIENYIAFIKYELKKSLSLCNKCCCFFCFFCLFFILFCF